MAFSETGANADDSALTSPPSDTVLDRQQKELEPQFKKERVEHWASHSPAVSDSTGIKPSIIHGKSSQNQTGNATASASVENHDLHAVGEVWRTSSSLHPNNADLSTQNIYKSPEIRNTITDLLGQLSLTTSTDTVLHILRKADIVGRHARSASRTKEEDHREYAQDNIATEEKDLVHNLLLELTAPQQPHTVQGVSSRPSEALERTGSGADRADNGSVRSDSDVRDNDKDSASNESEVADLDPGSLGLGTLSRAIIEHSHSIALHVQGLATAVTGWTKETTEFLAAHDVQQGEILRALKMKTNKKRPHEMIERPSSVPDLRTSKPKALQKKRKDTTEHKSHQPDQSKPSKKAKASTAATHGRICASLICNQPGSRANWVACTYQTRNLGEDEECGREAHRICVNLTSLATWSCRPCATGGKYDAIVSDNSDDDDDEKPTRRTRSKTKSATAKLTSSRKDLKASKATAAPKSAAPKKRAAGGIPRKRKVVQLSSDNESDDYDEEIEQAKQAKKPKTGKGKVVQEQEKATIGEGGVIKQAKQKDRKYVGHARGPVAGFDSKHKIVRHRG